ncbi:MAG: RHS repeat-associated core domain-containing protein [Clostridiaceae bacterium]|nr:RHS repeat-associated core domain-containing protein [Clostridiaceae bacterium]
MKNKWIIMAVLVLLLACTCGIPAYASSATTVSSLMKVLTEEKKDSIYNVDLNAPFSKETSGIRENVSTETGALIVSNNILSIPGRNGMDLNLNLVYSSQNAKVYDEGYASASISNSYGKTVVAYYDVYDSNGYWLRTGALSYSSTETILGSTTISGETWTFTGYLEYSGGTSLVTSSSIANAVKAKNGTYAARDVFGIGWSLDLPALDIDGDVVYVALPDGQTYQMDTTASSGLKDYKLNDVHFGADTTQSNGTDTSAYKLYLADGSSSYFTAKGEILLQTDRFGNTITYYWTLTNGLRLLTKIVDTAGRAVNISYDSAGAMFSYGNKTVSLQKTQITGITGKYYLSAAINAGGKVTTYGYSIQSASFDLLGKTAVGNTYVNLQCIAYDTGLSTNYTYGTYTKNLGVSGYMQYYKVESRRDIVGLDESNLQQYTYQKEPDGYPTYKAATIPMDYTYSMTVLTKDGTEDQYFYNYKHLLYQKNSAYKGITQTEKRSYDSYKNVPTEVVTSVSGSNGSYIKSRDYYTYDSRGNLTAENHPVNPEDQGSEYRTTYSYDPVYNLLTSKTYRQDADTTVKVQYTLSGDGKNVQIANTYSNGALVGSQKYEYDCWGNVTQSAALMGHDKWAVTKYTYAPEYGGAFLTNVTYVGITDANGKTQDLSQKYTYDFFSGKVLTQTDGNGNTTSYAYDALNRQIKETLPDGNCRTSVYDDDKNILTTTDAEGFSLVYRYDPFGYLSSISEKSAGAVLTTRIYDLRDNLSSSTDANGNKTAYTYDALNRVISKVTTDKKGAVTSATTLAYEDDYKDAYGNGYLRVTETQKGDSKDRVIRYYYNGREKLVKQGRVWPYGEQFSTFAYDYLWNQTAQTSYDGAKTVWRYDALGQVLSTTDPNGNTTTYAYDGLGNQISSTNALGATTYSAYDALNRKISTSVPQTDGTFAVTKYDYDGSGNLVKTVDPEGYITRNYYSSRGFLIATEQVISSRKSNIVKMEYDAEGRLVKQYTGLSDWDDENYAVNSYSYDRYGNQISETDPAGLKTTYAYDLCGNLLQTTDRNGVTTYAAYDGLNRKVSEYNTKDGMAKKITYAYDLSGNLTGSKDASGTVGYTYDWFGRVATVAYPDGMRKTYAYDSGDRITRLQVACGDTTEYSTGYEYGKAGQLTAVVSGGVRFTYAYDAVGRVSEEISGLTGAQTQYTYTPSGAVASLRTWENGEIASNLEYEYDLRGNQTKKIEDGRTTEYYYDALSRLKTALLPSGMTQDYEFDDYGNIIRMAQVNGFSVEESNYSYDKNNRLLLKETVSAEKTVRNCYEYDAVGNTVRKETFTGENGTSTNDSTEYSYNGRNQLCGVALSGGGNFAYTYNAEGLRSSKVSEDGTVNYVYQNGIILLEMDGDGAVTAKNVWGIRLLERKTADADYGYRFDGHGDIIALTDEHGTMLEDYSYDPYGVDLREETTDIRNWERDSLTLDNPFRYCGEYLDEETGLYYLRARYYDPGTGRFISEDTFRGNAINPSSLNLYVYCQNNPIYYTDPNGHMALVDDAVYIIFGSEIIAVTAEYLETPAGQKLLHDCAAAIYKGKVIAGGPSEETLRLAVGQIKAGVEWVGEKVGEAWDWLTGLYKSEDKADETSEGKTTRKSGKGKAPKQDDSFPSYPGDDPTKAPGEGWEWRGKGEPGLSEGSWYNPDTGESLHPDLDHPEGIDPHWDYNYKGSGTRGWRLFPDGTIGPK